MLDDLVLTMVRGALGGAIGAAPLLWFLRRSECTVAAESNAYGVSPQFSFAAACTVWAPLFVLPALLIAWLLIASPASVDSLRLQTGWTTIHAGGFVLATLLGAWRMQRALTSGHRPEPEPAFVLALALWPVCLLGVAAAGPGLAALAGQGDEPAVWRDGLKPLLLGYVFLDSRGGLPTGAFAYATLALPAWGWLHGRLFHATRDATPSGVAARSRRLQRQLLAAAIAFGICAALVAVRDPAPRQALSEGQAMLLALVIILPVWWRAMGPLGRQAGPPDDALGLVDVLRLRGLLNRLLLSALALSVLTALVVAIF